jgi:hypothetical protein
MDLESSSFRTWTPDVYETLHNALISLSEGVDMPLNQLAELLEICFPIFSNVLQNPLPAESDRTKLLARTVLKVPVTNVSDIETRGI